MATTLKGVTAAMTIRVLVVDVQEDFLDSIVAPIQLRGIEISSHPGKGCRFRATIPRSAAAVTAKGGDPRAD